jgi:hypothetical protein
MNVDFSALLSSGFIPGWLSFSLIVIWYLRTRAANRTADASIKDGEFKRVTDWNKRLQEECENCHHERDEARRERDEERAEKLMWKAAAEGLGIVRGAQAIADAEKRQAEREGEE